MLLFFEKEIKYKELYLEERGNMPANLHRISPKRITNAKSLGETADVHVSKSLSETASAKQKITSYGSETIFYDPARY